MGVVADEPPAGAGDLDGERSGEQDANDDVHGHQGADVRDGGDLGRDQRQEYRSGEGGQPLVSRYRGSAVGLGRVECGHSVAVRGIGCGHGVPAGVAGWTGSSAPQASSGPTVAARVRDRMEGHQLYRPSRTAAEGTSRVRTKKVSRMTAKAMV